MKLTDLKGKRQIRAISKMMALADLMADDEDVKLLVKAAGGAEDPVRALMAHGAPVLDKYEDGIIDVLAYIGGYDPSDYAENGNVLADAISLLTEDNEILDFLSSQQAGKDGSATGSALALT